MALCEMHRTGNWTLVDSFRVSGHSYGICSFPQAGNICTVFYSFCSFTSQIKIWPSHILPDLVPEPLSYSSSLQFNSHRHCSFSDSVSITAYLSCCNKFYLLKFIIWKLNLILLLRNIWQLLMFHRLKTKLPARVYKVFQKPDSTQLFWCCSQPSTQQLHTYCPHTLLTNPKEPCVCIFELAIPLSGIFFPHFQPSTFLESIKIFTCLNFSLITQ